MRTMRRRAASAALSLIIAVSAWATPAWSDEDDDDRAVNHVFVVNVVDGSSRTKARASIAVDSGAVVDSENVAVARASCTDCRTVAVAVQVLLVPGPVAEFRPANAALAINYACLRCETFAYARQEVLSPPAGADLDDAAEEAAEGIQAEIRAVAASDLPFAEMALELDRLVAELVAAIQAGFADEGGAGNGGSYREVDEDDD